MICIIYALKLFCVSNFFFFFFFHFSGTTLRLFWIPDKSGTKKP